MDTRAGGRLGEVVITKAHEYKMDTLRFPPILQSALWLLPHHDFDENANHGYNQLLNPVRE